MAILIRTMAPADIAPPRVLLSQLGYDMNAKAVQRRYEAIKEKHDHAVFVGEEDERVVALLHLYERPASAEGLRVHNLRLRTLRLSRPGGG